jgi:hypothetical protein
MARRWNPIAEQPKPMSERKRRQTIIEIVERWAWHRNQRVPDDQYEGEIDKDLKELEDVVWNGRERKWGRSP